MVNDWQIVGNEPENIVIMTKIDDANGCRNEQMMQKSNNLWWDKHKSMYVYYRPTHWRNLDTIESIQLKHENNRHADALELEAAKLRRG